MKTTQRTDSDTEETDLKLVQESPLTIEDTDLKSVQDSSLSVESPKEPEAQRPNLDRQLPPSPSPSDFNLTSPSHSTADENTVPLTCITCDSAVIDNCRSAPTGAWGTRQGATPGAYHVSKDMAPYATTIPLSKPTSASSGLHDAANGPPQSADTNGAPQIYHTLSPDNGAQLKVIPGEAGFRTDFFQI